MIVSSTAACWQNRGSRGDFRRTFGRNSGEKDVFAPSNPGSVLTQVFGPGARTYPGISFLRNTWTDPETRKK